MDVRLRRTALSAARYTLTILGIGLLASVVVGIVIGLVIGDVPGALGASVATGMLITAIAGVLLNATRRDPGDRHG